MDKEEKHLIHELVAKYTLEPELRDIFVEGPSDKNLFDWYLKENKCNDVAIFDINTVNVPAALIHHYNLRSDDNSGGNRDRVIVLSLELEKQLKERIKYLRCIADSDFDCLLGKKYDSYYLLYSTYTCSDLCFCHLVTIKKLFSTFGIYPKCGIEAVINNIENVLQRLFVIKAANEALEWEMGWIDYTKCCEIDNELIKFDIQSFVDRYLSNSSRLKNKMQFMNKYHELSKITVIDGKCKIHGHDYFDLMAWYVYSCIGKKGNHYRDPDVIRAIIFSATQSEFIQDKEPFSSLKTIYAIP